LFRASFRDSRDAARSLPFDSGNEEDHEDPRWAFRELVGFLLHPVSRSETRRRLKQLHANFGQTPLACLRSSRREADNKAEIHLANVSIWRKRLRIDNDKIVPDPGPFLKAGSQTVVKLSYVFPIT
jgi:hypothetical protein